MLLLAAYSAATAFLKSYEVQPKLAQWSGTVSGNPLEGVGQTFVCNFDSAAAVHLFVGDTGSSHAVVAVEIRDHATNTRVAYNTGVQQTRSHYWLELPLTPDQGQKFTRGKEYLVKWCRRTGTLRCAALTRPGADVDSSYPGLTMS
ncbi:hypothetical protein FJY71_05650 [candidate division WOR-3 bacterium]|nr:hypothetical protein [candidate division WOR-3 bacterium]